VLRPRDSFNRYVTDLRISVTDTCNFKCVFCHNEGLGNVRQPRDPRPDELSPDEIGKIVQVAKNLDFKSVKITGGEPTVRNDLVEIISQVSRHIPDVSMTTNGSMLSSRARELKDAGLQRVNISMHALDPMVFQKITNGSLQPVLQGIRAALEIGLVPVKINMVVYRDTERYVEDMIETIGQTDGLSLQLIQFMPDLKTGMSNLCVNMEPIKERLHSLADTVEIREAHHRHVYHIGKASVEVVDPVGNTEFCINCHRIRLTHDGQLKGCLNRTDDYVPIRGLDQDGIRDAMIHVIRNRVPYYGVYDRQLLPLLTTN
jgi:cyclic pyranopterin phosphate synthase